MLKTKKKKRGTRICTTALVVPAGKESVQEVILAMLARNMFMTLSVTVFIDTKNLTMDITNHMQKPITESTQ